mgnify:CR=1 FL=1
MLDHFACGNIQRRFGGRILARRHVGAVIGVTLAFTTGFALAALSPYIDGHITGSADHDFKLYLSMLFAIGLLAGCLCPRSPWLPPVAAFFGQFAAWRFLVPPDPLWVVGANYGLMLTIVSTGGGAFLARKLALRALHDKSVAG